ncbi:MAG: enoyl-CoA hydratase [Proteobacteria bacterium]|nr:enoyl-CoA hydratase [Pseudomonadota bacterium]
MQQRQTSRTPHIKIARADHVGWLYFDNPGRKNAISLDMFAAIPAVLDDFESDGDIRVVVMRGAGEESFISGGDISEFEGKRSTEQSVRNYDATAARAVNALERLSKPVIAMIHGFCLGGGVEVALGADLRIAAEDATFGIPASRLGIAYPLPWVHHLVALVGPAHASDILFTGRRLSAQDACAIGLVNRVVAKTELQATVDKLAATIAHNAPLSIRAARRCIHESVKDPAERDVALCERLIRDCSASEDHAEGRRAFLDKRRPEFRGR